MSRSTKVAEDQDSVGVPAVPVQMVESAHVLPHQCSVVTVRVEGDVCSPQESPLLEPDNLGLDMQVTEVTVQGSQ